MTEQPGVVHWSRWGVVERRPRGKPQMTTACGLRVPAWSLFGNVAGEISIEGTDALGRVNCVACRTALRDYERAIGMSQRDGESP